MTAVALKMPNMMNIQFTGWWREINQRKFTIFKFDPCLCITVTKHATMFSRSFAIINYTMYFFHNQMYILAVLVKRLVRVTAYRTFSVSHRHKATMSAAVHVSKFFLAAYSPVA